MPNWTLSKIGNKNAHEKKCVKKNDQMLIIKFKKKSINAPNQI